MLLAVLLLSRGSKRGAAFAAVARRPAAKIAEPYISMIKNERQRIMRLRRSDALLQWSKAMQPHLSGLLYVVLVNS